MTGFSVSKLHAWLQAHGFTEGEDELAFKISELSDEYLIDSVVEMAKMIAIQSEDAIAAIDKFMSIGRERFDTCVPLGGTGEQEIIFHRDIGKKSKINRILIRVGHDYREPSVTTVFLSACFNGKSIRHKELKFKSDWQPRS